MPRPRVRHVDLRMRIRALDVHRDPAARGRELDRVREQVPDDLLQAGGVAGHGPERLASMLELELDALRLRRGAHALERRVDDPAPRSTIPISSRSFPEMIRETSSRSSISFAWRRVLRSMASSARSGRASSSGPSAAGSTHVRIALSGERSSCESVARNSSFVAVGGLGRLARGLLARQRVAQRVLRVTRAQQRAHRRDQHRGFDRLGQRGVGAALERAHRVLLAHVRRRHLEHEHRRRRRIRLEPAADLPAVDVGQVDVEHDQPRSALGDEPQRSSPLAASITE